MTYNTARRKPLSKKQRPLFLAAHGGICYYCGEPILDDKWDDEHVLARELGGSDDMDNRRPIHRRPCHVTKSAADRKLIAHGNRLIRKHGPKQDRRKPKNPIRSRGFDKAHRPMQGRQFKRQETT